jgi:hypothetical protein
MGVLPQVAVRREMAMWRVFWVPKDAVRTGVRRRVLAGWEDLPTREDQAGIKAGDPIFLSPDHRVDASGPVCSVSGVPALHRGDEA